MTQKYTITEEELTKFLAYNTNKTYKECQKLTKKWTAKRKNKEKENEKEGLLDPILDMLVDEDEE